MYFYFYHWDVRFKNIILNRHVSLRNNWRWPSGRAYAQTLPQAISIHRNRLGVFLCRRSSGFNRKKKVDLLILDLQNVPILPNSAFFPLVTHQKCIIITSVYPIQMVGVPLNTIAFLDKPFTIESFTNAIEKFVEIVDD